MSRLENSARIIRAFKWVAFLFVFHALLGEQARATTINAATCSQTDVQAALNKAIDGDTVVIPAGTCTWTTTVSINVVGALTIMGAGSQSVIGGGDATIIVDSLPRTGGDVAALQINTIAGKAFRLTGITFQGGTNGVTYQGTLRIGGSTQQLRIDHVHFNKINAVANQLDGPLGVIDHCLYDMAAGSTNNGTRVRHSSWNGHNFGDGSWADAPYYGSSKFVYFENNTFNNGFANDCGIGGRFVFRNNTMNFSTVQTHEMSNRFRGCRAYEVYNNIWTGNTASPLDSAFFDTMGNGPFWGNSIQGFNFGVKLRTDRVDNSTYSMVAPPNGFGYCGTSFGPSAWDQNTDSTGYACLDQIGRGKGDLLANDFPNAINTVTNSISWPHQAVEPIYEWNNSFTKSAFSTSQFWIAATPTINQNRDYYLHASSFNGTSGVGTGLLSARPSTCTPYVAYWASDTNTLYQCSATNTWTVYYTPFTYPHPLTVGSGTPPAPPSGLQAIVN